MFPPESAKIQNYTYIPHLILLIDKILLQTSVEKSHMSGV